MTTNQSNPHDVYKTIHASINFGSASQSMSSSGDTILNSSALLAYHIRSSLDNRLILKSSQLYEGTSHTASKIMVTSSIKETES